MTLALRIHRQAWQKFMHHAHKKKHEVGCFAITSIKDFLEVEDFFFPKQECSSGYVDIDENSHASFMHVMAFDRNLPVECYMRIWTHTHPGISPQPSNTDEKFFSENYVNCDWAIMFIYACDGTPYPTPNNTFCRLRIKDQKLNAYLEGTIDVEIIDPLPVELLKQWDDEFDANIKEKTYSSNSNYSKVAREFVRDHTFDHTQDLWLNDNSHTPVASWNVPSEIRPRGKYFNPNGTSFPNGTSPEVGAMSPFPMLPSPDAPANSALMAPLSTAPTTSPRRHGTNSPGTAERKSSTSAPSHGAPSVFDVPKAPDGNSWEEVFDEFQEQLSSWQDLERALEWTATAFSFTNAKEVAAFLHLSDSDLRSIMFAQSNTP